MKLRGAEISVRIIREALESATQALREQLEHTRQEHEGVRVSLMQNLKEEQERDALVGQRWLTRNEVRRLEEEGE
jgi:hypothetical protein